MSNFFTNIDLSAITAQAGNFTGPQQLFVALVLLFVFLYGLSVGKTRAVISLLGMYIAFMLTATFPYTRQLAQAVPGAQQGYMVSIAFFLVAYLAVFWLLNYSSLKSRMTTGEMSFGKVLIVSILQVGFLGAIFMSFVPTPALPKGLVVLHPYLGTQQALFLWAIASLAILPFMKEGKRRSSSVE